MAKDFFKEKNVAFTDYDVAIDTAKRAEMIEKSGQMGVPVTEIDGEMILGFDVQALKEKLSLK